LNYTRKFVNSQGFCSCLLHRAYACVIILWGFYPRRIL